MSACEEAFRKMNNVLIDDRRIFVDFSQSGELIISPVIYTLQPRQCTSSVLHSIKPAVHFAVLLY